MKSLIAIVVLSSLCSCMKVKGTLDVLDHMTYRKNDVTKTLLAGEYDAKLKVRKHKLILKLRNPFERQRMKLELPYEYKLPRKKGTLELSEKLLDQPFSLKAKVNTRHEESNFMSVKENCHIYSNRSCNGPFTKPMDPNGPAFNNGPKYECGDIIALGERKAIYNTTTTTLDVKMDLIQDEETKATFDGESIDSKKVYVYKSVCKFKGLK